MILEALCFLITTALVCSLGAVLSVYFIRRDKRRADMLTHCERRWRVKP